MNAVLQNYGAHVSQSVSALPVSFDHYIRHGWCLVPIPPGTKGPNTPGWNRRENVLVDSSAIPQGYGVGIAHAYSGTMALDVDDWDVAIIELAKVGIDLQALYDAPDAVTIESGRSGHGKLLYAMPFGLVLNSKKLIYTTAEGVRKNYLDFRCATSNGLTLQDLAPPSIHPLTQQPYRWGGRGKWDHLPTIPAELLNYWQSLIEQDTLRTIKVSGSAISTSWDEIKSALDYISPDCSRDEWVQYMMAIHHAGTMTNTLDEAFALFDEWSSRSIEKYRGQGDIMNSWRGLKPDGGITLGTLFHKATENGWKRPIPDVTQLFSPISGSTSPNELIGALHVPPPEPDFSLLPSTLATRAIEVGESVGCDPLVAAWAGLGAVCAAADARIRLEIHDGWKVPPVLWLVTIGNPADKKTPAARPMLGILKQLELEDRPNYAAKKLIFEAMDAAYASAKKNYMQAASAPEFLLQGQNTAELPYVPQPPVPPIPKRLTVSDITSQKLVRMCADRPEGLLAHLDEMKSWADRLSNASSGENRSTWTKSYECDTETLDRVGDGKSEGNVIADNFAVSIYGNMQPRVFRAHMRMLSDDGFLQRFIPVILRDRMSDFKGTPTPPMFSSQASYELMIRRIHALTPVTYQLSPGAYALFREYQDWYLRLKKDERILNADDVYMTALGKIEGTCGRLILVWHLCEEPNNIHVSEETARKAIEFVKTYVINALRYVFGEVGGVHTDSLEHYVIEYVLQYAGEVQSISMSELRRSAKRRFEGVSQITQENLVRDAMEVLERAEWVKCIESNKKTTQWVINPDLANRHAAHRKAVIDARQRRYDMIHAKSGGRAPRRIAVGYKEEQAQSKDDPPANDLHDDA